MSRIAVRCKSPRGLEHLLVLCIAKTQGARAGGGRAGHEALGDESGADGLVNLSLVPSPR
jgi:hypothetical protein